MGLSIFRFIFRKMWKTRWMTISTLAGLIVAVAFTTSIPMYADGSLKRVVSTSLEEENQGYPAGSLLLRYQTVGTNAPDLDDFKALTAHIRDRIPEQIGFPAIDYVHTMSIANANVVALSPETDSSRRRQMSIMSMSGLAEHAIMTQGRMYSDKVTADGFIEAVVVENSLFRNYYSVGDEFEFPLKGGVRPVKIRVVGSFDPDSEESAGDTYWYQSSERYVNTFLIHEDVFETQLLDKGVPIHLSNWYYNFDLSEIQTSDLSPLSSVLNRMNNDLYRILPNTQVDISFSRMLDDFKRQSIQLQSLLLTLALPMIAMVFYYIVMNARQSLDRQRSDIAVLRSRGASNKQIFMIYLFEGLMLGGVAIVAGPFIGWFMAKSIGASNGFLSFVNRDALPVDVSMNMVLYGVGAIVIALIASLIPAVIFARSTIVGLRQLMARADRKPLWMRWYFDIVLILISGYGWYMFYERQFLSLQTGLSSNQMQVQPLLFFVPALTIFSVGLFFLRVFPWFLRLFNFLGRKFLPLPLYLTLSQMSRSSKAYYPLMILLILTLGMGVYNSSAARTIDLNSTEQLLYQYGADVVMETVWEGFADVTPTAPEPPGDGEQPTPPNQPPGMDGPPPRIIYREPPFQVFSELEGVKHAARVLQREAQITVAGRSAGRGIIMGIDNQDFAEVAWLERRDLFYGHHPNSYLNLLGAYEHAVLISEQFANRHDLKTGDIIIANLEQTAIEFVVVGIVPYWPSQYPDERPFFIANLDYIYDQIPLIPYKVWIKMEEGASVVPAMHQLAEKGIQLVSVEDARIELMHQDRHPSKGGVFGILSLGFLVSVFITLVGYILFWFFNLSSRVVQFGVLRAMGLTRRQLSGMLFLEQLFTAGLSIALGILIGRVASYLYLPFLQTTQSASMQVPPFRIIFEARDTWNLYIVVGVMMAIGVALLVMHVRKLRVHQAVKLGEER